MCVTGMVTQDRPVANDHPMLTAQDIVPLLSCPVCGQPDLVFQEGSVLCPARHRTFIDGNLVRIEGAQAELSSEWHALQATGAADYQEGHGVSQSADPVARQFGGFMAVTLKEHQKVLDIGCGMDGKLPDYVGELGLEGYIGLEPLAVAAPPAFPLLSGAIAERLPIRDGALDAVMFATSMDHIEDIDSSISEAKRVLRPGGRIYMWIGLYDPEEIARAKTFAVILMGSRLKRVVRLLAAHVEYAHTLWRMAQRKRRLRKGIRLDPYHCRYYTRDLVAASLESWKLEPVRSLVVPGAPSMFVEAVPE
jgi:SAM-dependent methyltransferase